MPTDEQPAAHFYGYYISFDATGVEPVDHVLKAIADAGRGSHRTHNWAELGLEEEIQRAAHEAAAVFQARDAEVQALREAVLELIECAEEASDRLKPPSGSLDFAIWNARRVLDGGETGETE